MSTSPLRRTRIVFVLAGVLMAAAALALLVAGEDPPERRSADRAPGTEAGSRFRDDPRTGDARPADLSAAEIERRVARLFVAGFPTATGPQRHWGALLVTDANYASPQQLRTLVRTLQRRARRAQRPVPLVFADPAILPGLAPADQPTLGVDGEPREAGAEARRAAARVRTAGIDVVLAPSADLGIGGGPAEPRAFGDDPLRVAEFVRAAVDGWLAGGVAPAPGRFPGEGAASQDPIEGPATVGLSLSELVARDLRPFAGVASRAPAIQMSAALYAAWDGVTPATLLPEAVALLRRRLGFRGVVVSADLIAATAATGEDVGRAAVDALRAGCDLLVVPGGREEQDTAFRAVVEAVRSGELPRARLDEALRRVTELRSRAGAS
jgi:beta-N-acetylhexosaminidase